MFIALSGRNRENCAHFIFPEVEVSRFLLFKDGSSGRNFWNFFPSLIQKSSLEWDRKLELFEEKMIWAP